MEFRKRIIILIALYQFSQSKGQMEREHCSCSCTEGNANICDYVRTINTGIETFRKNLGDEADKLKSDFERHLEEVESRQTAHLEKELRTAASHFDKKLLEQINTMKKEHEDRLNQLETTIQKIKNEEEENIRKLENKLKLDTDRKIDDVKKVVRNHTLSLEKRLTMKSREIAAQEVEPLQNIMDEYRMTIDIMENKLMAVQGDLQSIGSDIEKMKSDIQANLFEVLRAKVQLSHLKERE